MTTPITPVIREIIRLGELEVEYNTKVTLQQIAEKAFEINPKKTVEAYLTTFKKAIETKNDKVPVSLRNVIREERKVDAIKLHIIKLGGVRLYTCINWCGAVYEALLLAPHFCPKCGHENPTVKQSPYERDLMKAFQKLATDTELADAEFRALMVGLTSPISVKLRSRS